MARISALTLFSVFALAAGQEACTGAECKDNDEAANLNLLQSGYAMKGKLQASPKMAKLNGMNGNFGSNGGMSGLGGSNGGNDGERQACHEENGEWCRDNYDPDQYWCSHGPCPLYCGGENGDSGEHSCIKSMGHWCPVNGSDDGYGNEIWEEVEPMEEECSVNQTCPYVDYTIKCCPGQVKCTRTDDYGTYDYCDDECEQPQSNAPVVKETVEDAGPLKVVALDEDGNCFCSEVAEWGGVKCTYDSWNTGKVCYPDLDGQCENRPGFEGCGPDMKSGKAKMKQMLDCDLAKDWGWGTGEVCVRTDSWSGFDMAYCEWDGDTCPQFDAKIEHVCWENGQETVRSKDEPCACNEGEDCDPDFPTPKKDCGMAPAIPAQKSCNWGAAEPWGKPKDQCDAWHITHPWCCYGEESCYHYDDTNYVATFLGCVKIGDACPPPPGNGDVNNTSGDVNNPPMNMYSTSDLTLLQGLKHVDGRTKAAHREMKQFRDRVLSKIQKAKADVVKGKSGKKNQQALMQKFQRHELKARQHMNMLKQRVAALRPKVHKATK